MSITQFSLLFDRHLLTLRDCQVRSKSTSWKIRSIALETESTNTPDQEDIPFTWMNLSSFRKINNKKTHLIISPPDSYTCSLNPITSFFIKDFQYCKWPTDKTGSKAENLPAPGLKINLNYPKVPSWYTCLFGFGNLKNLKSHDKLLKTELEKPKTSLDRYASTVSIL